MDTRESPTIGIEQMDPELYKAAMNGDMELLTCIVQSIDLTLCLTPQKNTVLHIAVEFEKQEIVRSIIQLCPSLIFQPNSKGDTPLHMAARVGHLDLTKLLTLALNLNWTEGNPSLEEGNLVRQASGVVLRMRNLKGSNPIHEALKKSHREVALHLLAFEEGHHELACEVNMAGESLLYLAAEAGLVEVVQKIINGRYYSTQGPDGQNPLHIAVIKGRIGVVKILQDKELNLIPHADRFGNTVLHYASAKSYCMVRKDKDDDKYKEDFPYPSRIGKIGLQYALAKGYCRVLKDKDNDKYKELLWTEDSNQIQILQLLLKANQSLVYVPNINGDYPLFIAIRKDFGRAVGIILDHCPDFAELVNHKGQNALHLAVMGKNRYIIRQLTRGLQCKKLINEPDNDGNTPMHLATLTFPVGLVRLLIDVGPPDLTMSNNKGLTAMDICGYREREHPIRDKLRECGAVPGRHRWQEQFPYPVRSKFKTVEISPEFKKLGLQTLPIVTSLVATVTFAAAFTVPGGYKNDGPREGLPVFMRNAALQAFVLSDILAFCSSMAATVLLVYANAHSEDAFKIHYALQTCYVISGVAIVATITAFLTAVYVLTSKESLWLAVTSLLLGFVVPLFLFSYRWFLKKQELKLFCEDRVDYKFKSRRENV